MEDYNGDDRDWLRYEVGTTNVTVPGSPPLIDATYGAANTGKNTEVLITLY